MEAGHVTEAEPVGHNKLNKQNRKRGGRKQGEWTKQLLLKKAEIFGNVVVKTISHAFFMQCFRLLLR